MDAASGSMAMMLPLKISARNNVGTPEPQPISNNNGFSILGIVEIAFERYFNRPFLHFL